MMRPSCRGPRNPEICIDGSRPDPPPGYMSPWAHDRTFAHYSIRTNVSQAPASGVGLKCSFSAPDIGTLDGPAKNLKELSLCTNLTGKFRSCQDEDVELGRWRRNSGTPRCPGWSTSRSRISGHVVHAGANNRRRRRSRERCTS